MLKFLVCGSKHIFLLHLKSASCVCVDTVDPLSTYVLSTTDNSSSLLSCVSFNPIDLHYLRISTSMWALNFSVKPCFLAVYIFSSSFPLRRGYAWLCTSHYIGSTSPYLYCQYITKCEHPGMDKLN